jgi:hypothetical protein
VIEEFCAAFGPAKHSIREYFDLWESIYPHYSAAQQSACIKARGKYGASSYGPYYILAPALYPPEVMSKAWSCLDKAKKEAVDDETASARIEWLTKGLKQTDLMLATERAYERGIDTGDKSGFLAAYQGLQAFRGANQDYDKAYFVGLGAEEKAWKKADR